MRVRRAAEDVRVRLEGEQCDGDIGLDEREGTRIAKEGDDGRVFGKGLMNPLRVSDTSIESGDAGAVFETDGHAGQRTLLRLGL